jgi:hypothetical protein
MKAASKGAEARDATGASRRAAAAPTSAISHLHSVLGNQGLRELLQSRFVSRLGLGETVEEIGYSACDPDQGKMVWNVDERKVPVCMWDCAKEHELAHGRFAEKECTKVSAAYQAARDAAKKAGDAVAGTGQGGSKQDNAKIEALLKEAEEATKKATEAVEAYGNWFDQTCRKNEEQAYQAGIDKCGGASMPKQCADLGEAEAYKRTMADWQKLKNDPASCAPSPPKTPVKEKVQEPPKENEKKKEEEKKKEKGSDKGKLDKF